jgi:hypothetical protein
MDLAEGTGEPGYNYGLVKYPSKSFSPAYFTALAWIPGLLETLRVAVSWFGSFP